MERRYRINTCSSSEKKTIFLADTFTGVVKASVKDIKYTGGEHADTSLNLVGNLIYKQGLTNVIRLPSVFPDDTSHKVSGKILPLHIDVDVYQSSKDIVEWCLPRLSVGGIIVFDDYGFFGCDGVTTYCEELKDNTNLSFVYNVNGHGIFVKLK